MREEPSGRRRAMRDIELDGDLVRPRRRRRRRRGFVAGLLALLMPRRTTDALALAFAVAATVAVLVNALAFQTRSPGLKSAVPGTAIRCPAGGNDQAHDRAGRSTYPAAPPGDHRSPPARRDRAGHPARAHATGLL